VLAYRKEKGEISMHIYIPIWVIVVAVIIVAYLILVILQNKCPVGGFHDTIKDDDFRYLDGPVGPAEYCRKCKKWL
jgi:hypothetical protein